jgi:hypothetical protein
MDHWPWTQAARSAGGGLGLGVAGHAELCDGRDVCSGGVGDVAFDQPDLVDVREGQIGWGGPDLDGTAGDPAVSSLDTVVRDRGVLPGQRVDGIEQRAPVLFDREHKLTATAVDELGAGLDRVQRVRGDRRTVQGERVQNVVGGGRYVGLGSGDFGLGDHRRRGAGLGWAGQGRQQVHLVPVGVLGSPASTTDELMTGNSLGDELGSRYSTQQT